MRPLIALFFLILALFPAAGQAQTVVSSDYEAFGKARVVEVKNLHTTQVHGIDAPVRTQTVVIEVLDGPDKGRIVTFDNDYTQLATGDTFYIRHIVNEEDGVDLWSVADPYRLDTLILLAAAFVVLIFVFGGVQGIRGLASLIGSIALIFYILIPGIIAGYSPVLVSIGVASLIIIVGSYITHGFNRTTTAAVFGMLATVCITGIAAYYFIDASRVSGFTSEENVYLNFDTGGSINMVGLLFGGIMIGLLGVLYDIAISQAIAVEELLSVGNNLSRIEVYKRGIRIGREHIGALVNTLAIAYVGAALPLLLLIQSSTASLPFMLNSELFATELMRILLGSIGLIFAVPITTLIASYMLHGTVGKNTPRTTHTH